MVSDTQKTDERVMKNYVISIGRELGSGGKEIAEKLAHKLGIPVYDKKLLEAAAQESGIDASAFEHADEKESTSFFGNILGYIGGTNDSYMASDRLFQIQSEAMRNIAGQCSCITVGRCSEYVLREHNCLISIFITADRNDRIQRIMQKDGLDEQAAIERMQKGDKQRRSYHDYYATTEWGAARTYDLCINSSRLGIDGTVDFIFEYVKRLW